MFLKTQPLLYITFQNLKAPSGTNPPQTLAYDIVVVAPHLDTILHEALEQILTKSSNSTGFRV